MSKLCKFLPQIWKYLILWGERGEMKTMFVQKRHCCSCLWCRQSIEMHHHNIWHQSDVVTLLVVLLQRWQMTDMKQLWGNKNSNWMTLRASSVDVSQCWGGAPMGVCLMHRQGHIPLLIQSILTILILIQKTNSHSQESLITAGDMRIMAPINTGPKTLKNLN